MTPERERRFILHFRSDRAFIVKSGKNSAMDPEPSEFGFKEQMDMSKTYINPPETHNMPQFYSQAVSVANAGARTIHISGQVAVDAEGKLVGKEDLAAQSEQVFRNLGSVLKSAGAKPSDVVKINAYIVGLDGAKSAIVGAAMMKLFPGPDQPASTWVGVASLLGRGYLLEVEAVAVIQS